MSSARQARGDARRPSLITTAALLFMAAFVGIGPCMIMFLNEDGTSLSRDHNSHGFVSPRHILRSHRRGAMRTGSSPSIDRMRAGYEQMAKSQSRDKTKLRHHKRVDSGGDETKRRRLREVETERRRNGYPLLPPSSHGEDSQAPPMMAREPVPVQIIPANSDGSSSSRLSSLLYEGIESSQRLVLASSPHENDVVWLVDLSRIMCNELVDEADSNMRKRIERHRQATREGRASPFGQPLPSLASPTRLTSALQWKIIIIDFSDFGYVAEDDVYYGIDDFTLDCIKPLSDLIGRRNVYFASREHVLGRNIQPISGGDEEQPFGPLGERIDYQRMHLIHFMMGKVRRINFGHRTLLEHCLEDELSKKMEVGVANNNPLDMASLDRPYDISHFWKVGNDDNHTSVIRDAVNDVVRSLGDIHAPDKGPSTMKTFADQFGEDLGSFKSINLTCPLAREMLQYKILVVAQKDKYEGHYRLMDALLSGALVMTDPMSSLPLFLEDRVNIVVYRSPAELKRLLKFYLLRDHEAERIEIGRKGREIALRHHSPAAWVERMVFGNWSTLMG